MGALRSSRARTAHPSFQVCRSMCTIRHRANTLQATDQLPASHALIVYYTPRELKAFFTSITTRATDAPTTTVDATTVSLYLATSLFILSETPYITTT